MSCNVPKFSTNLTFQRRDDISLSPCVHTSQNCTHCTAQRRRFRPSKSLLFPLSFLHFDVSFLLLEALQVWKVGYFSFHSSVIQHSVLPFPFIPWLFHLVLLSLIASFPPVNKRENENTVTESHKNIHKLWSIWCLGG